MKFPKRIKALFEEPGYRTKLLIFFLIGLVLVLSSILITHVLWHELILQIAITFVTVAFVQILWGVVGGDPVEMQIKSTGVDIGENIQLVETRLENNIQTVDDKLEILKKSLHLLADLIDGNIGIERIWPDRRAWREDKESGLAVWQEWICQAKDVFIVSATLWNSWINHEKFRERLFDNLNQGATVKLVVYHPMSPVLEFRAKDEKDPKSFGVQQMQSEIVSSLKLIAELLETVSEDARKRFEIRLMYDFVLYSQIVHADDRMVVALYLSGKTGGPSPTFQLKGEQSVYFAKYFEQFHIIWDRAKKIEWNELKKLVEQYEGSAMPSQES
jgi:hypothetical protein